MLFRSISEHVKNQNWVAVAIDFLIVVIGVFIGIQVANWNEGRASREAYLQAIERARVEVSENLEFIDSQAEAIDTALSGAREGFDALLDCSDEPGALEKVNAGIVEIRGTRGFQTRTEAVDELTTNPVLLAEQSDPVRERLSELRFFQRLAMDISGRFEPSITDLWPSESSAVAIQPAEDFTSRWQGIEYTVPRYAVALEVGVQEACSDKALLNWFFSWETWQTNVLIFNKKLRAEYEDTLSMLQELQE